MKTIFFKYDAYGRVDEEYLAYPSDVASGSYRGNVLVEQDNYFANDYPFSKTLFENSPLNGILKKCFPGNEFQPIEGTADHAKEFQYGTNDIDEVRYYNVDINGNLQNSPSYYFPDEL